MLFRIFFAFFDPKAESPLMEPLRTDTGSLTPRTPPGVGWCSLKLFTRVELQESVEQLNLAKPGTAKWKRYAHLGGADEKRRTIPGSRRDGRGTAVPGYHELLAVMAVQGKPMRGPIGPAKKFRTNNAGGMITWRIVLLAKAASIPPNDR